MSPGEYDYHGGRFEVLEEGKVVIAGQRQFLAGSGVQTDVCIAKFIEMTGCSLAEAWAMATTNPARITDVECAKLEVGAEANFTLFEHDTNGNRLIIEQTIAAGEVVYTKEKSPTT